MMVTDKYDWEFLRDCFRDMSQEACATIALTQAVDRLTKAVEIEPAKKCEGVLADFLELIEYAGAVNVAEGLEVHEYVASYLMQSSIEAGYIVYSDSDKRWILTEKAKKWRRREP